MTKPLLPASRRGDVLAACAFNLVPIVGVVLWDWSVFTLIFLYWTENLIIGVRTLLSMLASGAANGAGSAVQSVLMGAFFTFHYGLFCLVHGVFVVAMFGAGAQAIAPTVDVEPFNMLQVAGAALKAAPDLVFGFAAIAGWQIVQFALFLVRGEARRTDPLKLMGAPYPRIIALHITILLGGFIVLALDEPIWGLVVLAILKAAFDIAAIARTRDPAAPKSTWTDDPAAPKSNWPRIPGKLNAQRTHASSK